MQVDGVNGFVYFSSLELIKISVCLQENFRVRFQMNLKHIQEFIQINITATR